MKRRGIFAISPVQPFSYSMHFIVWYRDEELNRREGETENRRRILHRFSVSPLLSFTLSPIHRFADSPLHLFFVSPFHPFSVSPFLRFKALDLHVPPILPPHFIQRLGDLPQRAYPDGVHQFGKNVISGKGDFLQALQSFRRLICMPLFKISQPL